jgi:DNA-directed RNA polymerase specialized sigma54-like protein
MHGISLQLDKIELETKIRRTATRGPFLLRSSRSKGPDLSRKFRRNSSEINEVGDQQESENSMESMR